MGRILSCSKYFSGVVEGVIKMIEKDLKGELSINDISSLSGYSEGHLRRMFKSVTGVSLALYVRKNKLGNAALDISMGRKAIDVAYEYGYSSQQSFCRAFKFTMGLPPSRYVSFLRNDAGKYSKPPRLVTMD
jgi:AraC family transcriptional regulator, mar-sox-rob regulon activator